MLGILFKVHVHGGGGVFSNLVNSAASEVTVGLVVVALKGNPAHFQSVHCVPPSVGQFSQYRRKQ